MKQLSHILLLLIWAVSCSNDIDKNITTDLQTEGNEIFRISLALEESLIYAFYTFEQYQNSGIDSLPGCPDVEIFENEQKVLLTFSEKATCPSQQIKRFGKITLLYDSISELESSTHLSYEDYVVKNFKIEGERSFLQNQSLINPHGRSEIFEDLLILDEFGSSSKISGSFDHQLTILDSAISEFTSSGQLDGRNITGRRIVMSQVMPRRYIMSCTGQGFVLPLQGVERWEIFRTATLSVAHNLAYELEEECESRAVITLSDGRILVLTL